MLCGAKLRRHWRSSEDQAFDFYDLKGAIESLGISELTFGKADWSKANNDFADPIAITHKGKEIGICGQLIKQWQTHANARYPVLVAEIDVDLVLAAISSQRTFHEIEKFPAVQRLSPSEKLIFVSELWNELEANPSQVPVSREIIAVLDRRMD